MKATILIFICGLLGCGFGQDEDEEGLDYLDDGVETPSGKIIGTSTSFFNRSAKAYLGIPYAKKPVGDLRFKKPQQLDVRDDPYWADTMMPACVQYSEHLLPWYDARGLKAEDCLYMNIWSPRFSPSRRRLPIIFWIYGGEFTSGSNRIYTQNGLGLSVMGSSIVVAPNYRVGAFGFLSDGTEDAPANVGIYDLIMALQWVQDNIAAFGGDTDQITLMGQGSGSIIVSLLLMSPLTKGLFSRAIMQSGSFLSIHGNQRENNIQLTRRLAEALDCPLKNGTIDCLRDVEADRLARTFDSLMSPENTPFLPEYGDEFLPKDPSEDLKAGNFHPVPLLIGTNQDEGSYLLTTRYPDLFGVFGQRDPVMDMEEGKSILRDAFWHLSNPKREAVVQQYLDDVDTHDSHEIRKQVYTAIGDYNVTCPVVYFAEEYSKSNGTVLFYVFSQKPRVSRWAHWMGVTHYEEIPFIFARPIRKHDYESFIENYNPELAISYAMAEIWGDFAKNGTSFEEWKNYTATHHKYIRIRYMLKKKMHGPGPNLDNCNFFREHFGF